MLRPGMISRYGGDYTPPVGTPYQDEVDADSPTYYWPDMAASPVANAGSGGSQDLTATGATMNVAGPLTSGDSKAAQTDGVDDYLSSAFTLADVSVVTIEFWLDWLSNSYTSNVDNPQYFGYGNPDGGFAIGIRPNGQAAGKLQARFYGGATNTAELDANPSAGWHHYVWVFDQSQAAAAEITPYIDGSAVTYTKASSGENSGGHFGNNTLYFGRDQVGRNGQCKLAHPAIYKGVALSAARIAAHYAAGT